MEDWIVPMFVGVWSLVCYYLGQWMQRRRDRQIAMARDGDYQREWLELNIRSWEQAEEAARRRRGEQGE